MATIIRLLNLDRFEEPRNALRDGRVDYIETRPTPAPRTNDLDGQPILSERGMILIGCAIFCTLFWSTLYLWITR